MACPMCFCSETYQYNNDDDVQGDEDLQRCAACAHIFYSDEAADDEDCEDDAP